MEFSHRPVPRVAAIHDLSGVGRCALTAVIPAMSALGVQVCPLPTACLSTQTDGFENFTFCDLTEEVLPVFSHWQKENLNFDGIFSGFLGSLEQVALIEHIFSHSEGALCVADPVMGDNGALYPTVTSEMGYRMRELCGKADVITPNLTECVYLIDRPYSEGVSAMEELKSCLKELCGLGCKTAVLTGVSIDEETLINCAYERESGNFYEVRARRLSGKYPGTGDLFTSVLTGLLVRGFPMQKALEIATDYLSETIRVAIAVGAPPREGVPLERTLPLLMKYNT
ncbi:MAG: pyridoxamine kinase [Clostridia bacterium]|nr:pyridoxamine kinase [Clostridia bacterium]